MFYVALATDYDGTLAQDGRVDDATCAALADLRRSGRKLILVTGRDLPDLQRVFPALDHFDLVVAENGGLLFDPLSREETALAPPPPQAFVDRLAALGVSPLSVGRTIVATWEPNEGTVLQAIRELELELHIIFNKGAVMVLPGGINKASGFEAALERLKLSGHNVVGIGDAENDQAFLGACGCAVAVENALDTVKAECDLIVADHGRGVVDLVRRMIEDDLGSLSRSLPRAQPAVGRTADGGSLTLSPFETVLVTGLSGGGKSTLVTALLEQIRDLAFQFCVVDPEGDYSELRDAVILGDPKQPPHVSEVVELLVNPEINVVVNLLAINPDQRPVFLAELLPALARMRAETGRPHWIVVDEVHHCLPATWRPAPLTLPIDLPAAIAVTVHPDAVAPAFLQLVSTVVGVGEGAQRAIGLFCSATGRDVPRPRGDGSTGEALVFRGGELVPVTVSKPRDRQKRHVRKYAEGELGKDKSFYFRGPEGALNLRAQNLILFLQLAEGVDDGTWLHHLHEGAYSRWFRDAIKDDELAAEVEVIERDRTLAADRSRAMIRQAVEKRYTAPAKA